jgi:hypothetical protein
LISIGKFETNLQIFGKSQTPYQKMIFLIHGHFDLKISHFDSKNCLPDAKEAAESLIDFTDDVGIPETLVMDGVTEFTGKHTDFIKQARQMWIKLHTAEQGRTNQNHVAEWEIGFLSKCCKLRMQKKNVYSWLWDYGLVYKGELLTRMSRGNDHRSGYEQVTGKTPDISECLDFEFYDLLWWWINLTNQTLMMRQNDWEDGLAYLTV